MSIKIGVIAEDTSDIEVIGEILSKYLDKNRFSIKKFVGQGCGKMKSKCAAWVDNLSKLGCQHIFIFHDLDRNDEATLKKDIQEQVNKSTFKAPLIVIPTEELEAWLLSDVEAIKKTFSINAIIKPIADVEQVKSPKEHLGKMVKKLSGKVYVNTIHNKKIAGHTEIESLNRCNSYRPLNEYIVNNLAPPKKK